MGVYLPWSNLYNIHLFHFFVDCKCWIWKFFDILIRRQHGDILISKYLFPSNYFPEEIILIAVLKQRIIVVLSIICCRNFTLGLGMCPKGQWEKLVKGSWVKTMSPFDRKLLDIRMSGLSSNTIEVSLEQGNLLLLNGYGFPFCLPLS